MKNLINTLLFFSFLLLFIVKCCRIDDSIPWFVVFAPALLLIVYNIIMAFIQFTNWDGESEA